MSTLSTQDVAINIRAEPLPVPDYRRSARLCGREITKCGAHLIFFGGYLASGGGLFYAAVHSLPITGGLSAGALCIQALAHRWWVKYSNITNASEYVHGAAVEAREAAEELQKATSDSQMVAQRVTAAAGALERGAAKISQGISEGRVIEIESRVSAFKEGTEGLLHISDELKGEIGQLRAVIAPISSLVMSFKKYLLSIRQELAQSMDKIEAFSSLERRFSLQAESLHSEVEHASVSIQEILKVLSEDALLTLQVLRESQRHFTALLQEKNRELSAVVESLSEISRDYEEGQAQRRVLMDRIAEQERQNIALQERVRQIVEAIEAERRLWDEGVAKQGADIAGITHSLSREREQIQTFIERLNRFIIELDVTQEESEGEGVVEQKGVEI